MTDPIFVLTILLASVGAADWLGKRGFGKRLGDAVSVGRQDLVLPGVLAGALGNALGTYLGFVVASPI
jgi:uncharacterized membrane protein